MTGLAAALGLAPGGAGLPAVAAFVGAGGKTSAIFAVAASAPGLRVAITTTTRIRDPRGEAGRRFDRVVVEPSLASPGEEALPPSLSRASAGPPLVIAAGLLPGEGKLLGVHPDRVGPLAGLCDLLLVEADGARGLPVKAPGPGEPAMPGASTLVVGVVGLGCLGRPMGPGAVHRPERFAPVAGCAIGEKIGPRHLASLIASPEGLFKGSPAGCRRAVLLNQADAADAGELRELLDALREAGAADLVVVASLEAGWLKIASAGPTAGPRPEAAGGRP